MKIFATSDLHGDRQRFEKLTKIPSVFPEVDLVLICGDIGGKSSDNLEDLHKNQVEDYKLFKQKIDRMRQLSNRRLFYILGNDDWFEPNDSGGMEQYMYWTRLLGDDHEVSENRGRLFHLIPFEYVLTTPFHTNREANENKIQYELFRRAGGLSKEAINHSIFVAHDVPKYCLDEVWTEGHVGSTSIRKFIEERQPKAWFCGHIHEQFGWDMIGKTYVFNCACNEPGIINGWIFDTKTSDFSKVVF